MKRKIPELKVYLNDVEFPLRSVINLDARKGSNDLARLFNRRDIFKNPKPVELLETILSYSTSKDSLILDAFAGSGTTGEAAMKLNASDNGQRRFILIEEGQDHDKFCRTVAAKRLKLAMQRHRLCRRVPVLQDRPQTRPEGHSHVGARRFGQPCLPGR